MQQTIDKIRTWGIVRGLDTANPKDQALKLGEEFGEVCEALNKDDQDLLEDAIGDCVVVLTNLAMQKGTSIEHCTKRAYEEIKDRKGKMINGVFVKEADLT